MNFTSIFSPDKLFGGNGDSSNPIMWIVWIVPIVLFVFYGQRIQLIVTSSEINKNIEKLKKYKDDTKKELLEYLQKSKPIGDTEKKIENFMEYFTIMPVDIDPNGIMPKIKHLLRTREDYTKKQVMLLAENLSVIESSKIQNLLEIATSLNMLHKIVRHLFLTAKKQNNFPLILPLQMMLPFIMEQAEALEAAVSAIKKGQPIGDGIGPMVIGKMMLRTEKKSIGLETVYSETDFEGRRLILLKAEGPNATVGRPGDAVEKLVQEKKPTIIIMVDAGLKLEGEQSATIAHGFGAAIGGIGTDRFQIEDVATKYQIPVFAIVIKQSIKEAITLMTKEIADKADEVESQIYENIRQNTDSSQSVLIVGVGNTLGVPQ